MRNGITGLRAYQQGGPILDKLKQLWEGIRGRADDPSLGYIGASMMPGVGEATDLVEIGAGLQDRDLGRIGLGLGALALPFVGAPALRKILKSRKKVPSLKAVAGEPDVYFDPSVGKKIHIDPETGEINRYLPMDEASVAGRIKDQGYEKWYHSSYDPEKLRSELLGENKAFYQAIDPDVLESYGGGIEEVYSRAPNQLVFDAGDHFWGGIPVKNVRRGIDPGRLEEFDRLMAGRPFTSTDEITEVAREMGYSGWDAHRLRDASYSSDVLDYSDAADIPTSVRATIDRGLVRFEGARFDPLNLGSVDPFAGIAGLLGLGAAGAARRNYVEREE